ncbi:MAG: hypothetical protein ACKOHK_07550, partial [Planctomycetia bacterium]
MTSASGCSQANAKAACPRPVVVAALLAVGGTSLPGARAFAVEPPAAQAQTPQTQAPAIPPRN